MNKTLAAALLLVAGAAQADNFQLDATHTFAGFEWFHFGLAHHGGKFTTTTGTVMLDTAKKTGSADISIDVNSISTGVAKLDEHLKSPDFFDAAKYPAITFKSKAFNFDGAALKSVDGDLTIHGMTKPVTLAVTHFACMDHPMKKVPACGVDANATIKRTDFGMGLYAPGVSDEINIRIEVEATKKA